ncbi:hypothetical protein C8J56DRAFT_922425 [Mycena floridula]|nr:hypothetical protein C8J56DRAFT_922425 [Mycena floridula]
MEKRVAGCRQHCHLRLFEAAGAVPIVELASNHHDDDTKNPLFQLYIHRINCMLRVLILVTIALVNLVLAVPIHVEIRAPKPVIRQRQLRFDPGVGLFPRTRGNEFAKQLIESLQNHPTPANLPVVESKNNRVVAEKDKPKANLPVIKGQTTKAHQMASNQAQLLSTTIRR